MSTKLIDGIACRRIETGVDRNVQSKNKRYGAVPLEWLKNLPGDCGKAKIVVILWFLNAVKAGEWFSITGQLCKEYGVSPSQKIKILNSLEHSGHVKLQRVRGKTSKIKLVKPEGWM